VLSVSLTVHHKYTCFRFLWPCITNIRAFGFSDRASQIYVLSVSLTVHHKYMCFRFLWPCITNILAFGFSDRASQIYVLSKHNILIKICCITKYLSAFQKFKIFILNIIHLHTFHVWKLKYNCKINPACVLVIRKKKF